MNLIDMYKNATVAKPVGMLGKGLLSLGAGYTISPAMKYYNQKKFQQTGKAPGGVRKFVANNPLLTSLGVFTGWQGGRELLNRGAAKKMVSKGVKKIY